MPENIAKEQRKVKIIASSLVALFLIIMLFILFLNARSSYASNSSDIAQTTNSDPYAQFCSSFYHVTSSTPSSGPLDKYNEWWSSDPPGIVSLPDGSEDHYWLYSLYMFAHGSQVGYFLASAST